MEEKPENMWRMWELAEKWGRRRRENFSWRGMSRQRIFSPNLSHSSHHTELGGRLTLRCCGAFSSRAAAFPFNFFISFVSWFTFIFFAVSFPFNFPPFVSRIVPMPPQNLHIAIKLKRIVSVCLHGIIFSERLSLFLAFFVFDSSYLSSLSQS